MPSHLSSAKASSPGSILLLEEYAALAAAIGSALKKFAPERKVFRARSLAEAEQIVDKNHPDVVILDVDPPWLGITTFIEKLRDTLPGARALVIGAGIPDEISAERGSFGALQFIGKPFELAAFGAAIQAVLGPWRESGSANSRGTLQALNTLDVLLLHCAGGGHFVVDLNTETGRSGKVCVSGGHITHVETGNLIGGEALRQILNWNDVRLSETKAIGPVKRIVHRDWIEIVVEHLSRTKTPTPPQISPEDERPPVTPAQAKTGKKIVVIDDTEMLLIFVEDVLATEDPQLQITTALTGAGGIEQIEEILPNLVLLDYSLPDINGDEVCRRLLENDKTAGVPVLMMSGHVAEMNATAAAYENVVAAIEKPFLSDALIELVRKTLEASPRHRRSVAKQAATKPTERVAQVESTPKPRREKQPVAKASPHTPISVAPEIRETPRPIASERAVVHVATADANTAILGLFLEVISMQLTPQLQMGAIRAKPASPIVSLHLSSATARGAIPPQTAFQLGRAELNAEGHISAIRLFPSAQPFQRTQTQNAFAIGGVALIPNHTRARVQLTPAGSTPMTIELIAQLELGFVQLSNTFQIAQLVLKWPTNIVRVTLNPKATERTGAAFESSEIKLDSSGRLAELLLRPATRA